MIQGNIKILNLRKIIAIKMKKLKTHTSERKMNQIFLTDK